MAVGYRSSTRVVNINWRRAGVIETHTPKGAMPLQTAAGHLTDSLAKEKRRAVIPASKFGWVRRVRCNATMWRTNET